MALDTGLLPLDHPVDTDTPLPLKPTATGADRVFRVVLAACGTTVLVVLGAIIIYLVKYSTDAWHKVGLKLVTSSHWAPPFDLGILGALVGSVVIALIALTVALPVSVASALMINEYAPKRLRNVLVTLIDLLATVPSIVYGFWGLVALADYMYGTTKFLDAHGGFIPLFRTPEAGTFGHSIFLCGLVVAVMIIPIVTSISREVMARAPRDACEGALALGGTRWGMVTDVVLPYARNGIIGAALLGLGRALGETMAVYLILSTTNVLTPAILGPNGLGSISYLIAQNFTSYPEMVKSALTAAGLILFATTLTMNLVARLVVKRSAGDYA
ncbi:MAG TPA: phosphate ABC transporter permease subunit PstC [Acidimicrobiales bacterium]|nr:phosphate ABC transporter permease subunit PstC [Acidimicrobiales bacterium]